MANVLDDILSMAEIDPEEIGFIRAHIPAEVSEKYDDEQLQYVIDVIFEYIDEKDEEDEIAVDDVAQYVAAQAKKEEMGNFDADELSLIVDADLDFLEGEE